MNEQQIRQQVRDFLRRFFREHNLRDDEDIFATGYVNSMFAMQLVQFVEGEFCILIESEDLELDNFRSLDAITALVMRKQGAPAA